MTENSNSAFARKSYSFDTTTAEHGNDAVERAAAAANALLG